MPESATPSTGQRQRLNKEAPHPISPRSLPHELCQAFPTSESAGTSQGMGLDILAVLWECTGSELAWSAQGGTDPQGLTPPAALRVESHSDDLTSRSPASKDQTSSLVSTCHTFKRPLMSPVATRVESWLKPAQVTESLWPAKKSGQKEKRTSGYLVLGTQDPAIWPPERTSWEKKGWVPAEQVTKLRAAPGANIPMSPQGRHCWPPTQPRPMSSPFCPLHISV